MNNTTLAPHISTWLAEPLSDLARSLILAAAESPGVARIAVMPDVHPADAVCNGCVIAVRDRIYPQAVGQDIGCGFSAVQLVGPPVFQLASDTATEVLQALSRGVPIIRHGKRSVCSPDAIAALGELSHPILNTAARRDGLVQFGTLGRGNHFLELQRDDDGGLWLMVHSGSRAMGRVIYGLAMRSATRVPSGPLSYIEARTDIARDYMRHTDWATRYASASRSRMLHLASDALSDMLDAQPDWSTLRDSPHNTLSVETFDDTPLYIHRKGAARALASDAGIIAGSAGTFSVHTTGKACDAALRSCSHGAGRVLSRSEARSQISVKELRRTMQRVTFDTANASRLVEEAPSAYRDLRVVLEAQRNLVRTVRRLTPLVSCKAV